MPSRFSRLALIASLAVFAGCGSDTTNQRALDSVKHALDTIVRERQAAYFAAHGAYTADAEALSLGKLLPEGVRVRISAADANGWSAAATHTSLPTTPCTLYVGTPSQFAALPTPGGSAAATLGREGRVQCAEAAS